MVMEANDPIAPPNREAVGKAENIYHTVQRAFPEAVQDFESKWTAFQLVRQSLPPSASPIACTRTTQFDTLRKQGPKILPIVVFKIASDIDQSLYGVFLCKPLALILDYCAENFLRLARCVHCVGDEYSDLLDMGPAFIPLLMVEYSQDRSGYWYELIHEIVHGRTTEAYCIFERDGWFEVWCFFLNGCEYKPAPKYMPNEMDIRLPSFGRRARY